MMSPPLRGFPMIGFMFELLHLLNLRPTYYSALQVKRGAGFRASVGRERERVCFCVTLHMSLSMSKPNMT